MPRLAAKSMPHSALRLAFAPHRTKSHGTERETQYRHDRWNARALHGGGLRQWQRLRRPSNGSAAAHARRVTKSHAAAGASQAHLTAGRQWFLEDQVAPAVR